MPLILSSPHHQFIIKNVSYSQNTSLASFPVFTLEVFTSLSSKSNPLQGSLVMSCVNGSHRCRHTYFITKREHSRVKEQSFHSSNDKDDNDCGCLTRARLLGLLETQCTSVFSYLDMSPPHLHCLSTEFCVAHYLLVKSYCNVYKSHSFLRSRAIRSHTHCLSISFNSYTSTKTRNAL